FCFRAQPRSVRWQIGKRPRPADRRTLMMRKIGIAAILAAALIALAPAMRAQGQGNGNGISALTSRVTALEATVARIEAAIASLQSTIDGLGAQVAGLQTTLK